MEHTRASIRDTVEELRGKVSATVDWRQHVCRRPGASLAGALWLGIFVGRVVGARAGRGPRQEPHGVSEAPGGARPAYQAIGGPRRVFEESASQLGSRAESVLTRLMDELTDAVTTTLIPALTARFRRLLDFEGRHVRSGPDDGLGFVEKQAPESEPEQRWDRPAHEEPGGVYPGTPAKHAAQTH
jgi:hypothetical protein